MSSGGSPGRERAVTVQIGAVILFGFLIVALSTYQATVVPDQNREVEFLHSQEVQTDMVELSSSVSATGRTGDAAPATVSLGTRYPSRAFFVNPPPASGTLRTVEPPGDGNVSLDGVDVRSSVDGEANDYWSDAASRNTSTRFVVYEPRNNLYREAPTTRLESGVAFNNFSRNRNVTLTEQSVVEGNRITLLAVSGELREGGVGTASIDPESISSVSRRERVSGTLTITLPTTLDNGTWEELLSDEIADGWVNGTRQVEPGRVAIDLNDSRTYSLGIAAVQVGSGTAPEPRAAYTDIERAPSETSVGSTREVVVEVRDEYGNPVSGVAVDGETNASGELVESTVVTTDEGRAVFEFTPNETGSEELNFTYDGLGAFDASAAAGANVTIEVNAGSGGGGGGPNPAESGEIRLEEETRVNESDTVIDLVLNNTAEDTVVNVTDARINFYFESKSKEFDFADVQSPNDPNSARLRIAGPFEALSPQISLRSATTTTVRLEFGDDGKGGDAKLNDDELFVITLRFDNGESDSYFVNTD